MEIPLTSFIDFVMKSGSPKMTAAKKILTQQAETYDPISDYYKRFRDGVVELHKGSLKKNHLGLIIGDLPISKKRNYAHMIEGYHKFIGRKKTTWFTPPRETWIVNEIQIPINPELGLEFENKKYLIKLYLKAEKPSKDRVACILALMKNTLPPGDYECTILDVRNGKLYIYENQMNQLMPLVEGEASNLQTIIRNLY